MPTDSPTAPSASVAPSPAHTRPSVLFESSGVMVEQWNVIAASPSGKTLTVKKSVGRWKRRVHASDIGKRFFVSAIEALEHARLEVEDEVKSLKNRLHTRRTLLEMIDSELRRRQQAVSKDSAAPSSESKLVGPGVESKESTDSAALLDSRDQEQG